MMTRPGKGRGGGATRADDDEHGKGDGERGRRVGVRLRCRRAGRSAGAALELVVPGELLAHAPAYLAESRRVVEGLEEAGRRRELAEHTHLGALGVARWVGDAV